MLDRIRRIFRQPESHIPIKWPSLPGMVNGVYHLPPNSIIDNLVDTISFSRIKQVEKIRSGKKHLISQDYQSFLRGYIPDWERYFPSISHKKLLEFFVSYSLLDPREEEVFLDAAGGAYTYIHRLPCQMKYLQDIVITDDVKQRYGDDIEYIESNAANIPLESNSVDKISCHHSIEHFEADVDVAFVKEIQRLLSPGGICCIVPIFIGNRYVEITNLVSLEYHFDPKSYYVIDPTASIPGYEGSNHYARIYDIGAFERRILAAIDTSAFSIQIYQLYLDDSLIPDLNAPYHMAVTGVNFPYRALVIKRIH